MTNGKRRRMMTLLLLLCLLLIVAIMAQMWVSLTRTAVEYGETIITPDKTDVCPGDVITFPVDITIERGNSVSRVTEGWCREDGICPRVLQEAPVYYNFIAPYSTSATARRTVPGLTPGPWQLRHCNETHSTGVVDVVCWQVDVTVKDCAP